MSAGPSVEPLGRCDRVVLDGEVDMAAAPALEREILRRTRASRAVVVDLSRVRYLDSGGVRLVDHLVADCDRRGLPVRVVAPRHSPARASLKVGRFPEDRLDETVDDAAAAVEVALT